MDKNERLNLRLDKNITELLELKAKEDKCSISEIIRKSLSKYMVETIGEDTIIHGRLEQLSHDVDVIDKKVDLLSNLFVFWLDSFYAFAPELPSDEASQKTAANRGRGRKEKLLKAYGENLQENKASLYHRIMSTLKDFEGMDTNA